MIAAIGPAALWLASALGLLTVTLSIGPWRGRHADGARALAVMQLLLALIAIAAFLMLAQGDQWTVVAGTIASVAVLRLAWRDRPRARLVDWGTGIAVAGLIVALTGVAAAGTMTIERSATLNPGDAVAIGPWRVRFEGVAPVAGLDWTALEARLAASRKSRTITLLPQRRTLNGGSAEYSEAAAATPWEGRISAVMGTADAAGRIPLLLRWNPLANLAWFGGALIILGGLFALAGSWWRGRSRDQDE